MYLYGIIWLPGSAVCICSTVYDKPAKILEFCSHSTEPRQPHPGFSHPSFSTSLSVCLSFLHSLAAQVWSIPVVCRTDKQMCLHMIAFTLERKVENCWWEVNLVQRTTPPVCLCLLYLEVSQPGWWAQPTPSTLWNNFPLPQIWATTENEVWIQLHA